MRPIYTVFTAFLIIFTLFAGVVGLAEAASAVRTGDTISLQEGDVVEGNLYVAASKVSVSGEVAEDLTVAAGQVTINGAVKADTLIVAGTVEVHGPTGDDLRVVAGDVTIAEPVNGDLFILGGSVDLLSTASVTGDVIIYAGEVTIEGSVGGNVYGYAETMRLDATVGGGVDVTVGMLTLGDRAVIQNNLRYKSNNHHEQSLNATVIGETLQSDLPAPTNTQATVQALLIPVLVILFSALVWYWISARSLNAVIGRVLVFRPRQLLLGFGVLFLTPVVAVLLVMSGIGVLLSIAVLFAYLLAVTLAIIAMPAVLGQLLFRSYSKAHNLSFLSVAVGGLALAILLLLSFIGAIIMLLLVLVTLGAMLDLLLRPTLPARIEEDNKKRS